MAATDDHASKTTGLTSTARKGMAITPHDTNELTNVTRGLLAYTTAGKCAVTLVEGDDITIYLALGAVVAVAAKIVKTTGTDAVGITGVY